MTGRKGSASIPPSGGSERKRDSQPSSRPHHPGPSERSAAAFTGRQLREAGPFIGPDQRPAPPRSLPHGRQHSTNGKHETAAKQAAALSRARFPAFLGGVGRGWLSPLVGHGCRCGCGRGYCDFCVQIFEAQISIIGAFAGT